MSKAILMSIKPKWCELIASGKKTVEVRKTKPKLETPFKVYIYRTKGFVCHLCGGVWWNMPVGGTVIGEFICNGIFTSFLNNNDGWFKELGCLTQEDIDKYQGDNPVLYGWRISDLVIYDNPKELREFFYACDKPKGSDCSMCLDHRENRCKAITRPPQSWGYVEERLPDKEGTYLTYTDKDNVDLDIFCIYPSHGTKFWSGERRGKVTHWMPLPEAPKGGAE